MFNKENKSDLLMDIQAFLDLCVGQWFSQRSIYYFQQEKAESHKSELIVEWLERDHTEVFSLCQQYQINSKTTIGAQKITWDTSTDWGKPKQIGSAIIIFIPDVNKPEIGRILRKVGNSNLPAKLGNYSLGEDEALTLTLEDNNNYLEERLSFASPNLRLRTSLTKARNGFSQTAFYSEIRKLPPQAAA
ncbi:chorismate-binding protein [Aphanothece sacrum FPU3]|nr:chorismate-binding protein [Aphanothece sacrum FPU3]